MLMRLSGLCWLFRPGIALAFGIGNWHFLLCIEASERRTVYLGIDLPRDVFLAVTGGCSLVQGLCLFSQSESFPSGSKASRELERIAR